MTGNAVDLKSAPAAGAEGDDAAQAASPGEDFDKPVYGIILKVVSVCCFMAMVTAIKAVADRVPPGEVVFFRNIFAIPVILIWLFLAGEAAQGLKTQNKLGHVWRSLAGTGAMALNFAVLAILPLPEVTAISFAAPLLAVVLATFMLGERVGIVRIGLVALGLLGVVVIIAPRLTLLASENVAPIELIGVGMAIAAALLMALAQIFARKLVRTETTSAVVFYFTVMAALLSLLTLPWGWQAPDAQTTPLLIIAGVCGGLGQIFLIMSYRRAQTAVIAPFEYVSMLLALVIGYVVFDEVATTTMLAGAALVMLAGILVILREWQLGVRRRPLARTNLTQ